MSLPRKKTNIVDRTPVLVVALLLTSAIVAADWRDGKLHRLLTVHLNGQRFGQPDAGTDMVFSFPQLVTHLAKTRNARAGRARRRGNRRRQEERSDENGRAIDSVRFLSRQ